MAEAVVVVGWFLTPNITKIINLALRYAAMRFELHRNLPRRLGQLAEDLQRIKFMVDAAGAEGMGFVSDPPRDGNLWRLKDAIYDAEELLDELHMEILGNQHHTNPVLTRARVLGRQVFGNNRFLNKLEELLDRLRRLPQNARDLLQTSQHRPRPIPRPTTGPMPRRDDLFGYAREYDKLLSSLTTRSGGEAGVIAITGHAGMGKTELARRAFHDERIVKDFSLRLWVCVYGKFNETDLLKEIWMSALGGTDRAADEMNLTRLQEELTKFRRKWRRYLLVLDDVCNDESTASDLRRRSTWETVLAPFRQHGDQGSRILMTTRAKICLTTLDAGACIQLNGIDNQASVLLIKKTAFGDEHAKVHRDLQVVLDGNVDKLHGSPLAAKEVGIMLQGVDEKGAQNRKKRWKEIMNSDHHDGVFRCHLSSYQDLPPHLQRCLAFCSIFPKKWRFEHEKLIMMWIALGLVEGPPEPNAGRTAEEDVGRGYFDDLLQRSLFQEIDAANDNSEVNNYVINEHLHSMLRKVCPDYYLCIDRSGGASVSIPATVRHLSVTASCLDQLNRLVPEQKKMRTLLVFKDDDDAEVRAIDSAVLGKFEGVRVLDLSETCITELPDAIPMLRHVRYLGLPNTIHYLGTRFPRLLLLQTLYLKSIARRMASIGCLDKMQGSVEIHAGNREQGYGMRELENLNSLRRLLCIKGLETAATREEAQGAQLHNKEHLKILKLEWDHRGHQQAEATDLAVLEGLQPHSNLEKLHITGYNGTTTPAWLEDPSVLGNLSSLYLRNCRKLLELPLVGRIDHLEKLVLHDMPELVSWDAEPGGDGIYTPPLSFTTLKEVQIIDCPSLTSVSVLQLCTSLTDLRMHRCPAVRATLRKSMFPYLKKPDIVECPGLQFEESPGLFSIIRNILGNSLLTATIARNP